MSALTVENIREFAPNIHSSILVGLTIDNSDEILLSGGIDTAMKLAHFMGQCFVETGGFKTLTENLNYSADRLIAVWPSKFNHDNADTYAHNSEMIANYTYGGRMGNNKNGDGYKYRGGGLLDMTGKSNYLAMTKKTKIDLVNNPDMARNPSTCLKVAVAIWQALGCNGPAEDDNGDRVTRLVNGGMTGAEDRANATDRAKDIFQDAPTSATPLGLFSATETHFGSLATPLKTSLVPLTPRQAQALQAKLKDKNYAPGDLDGNINNPSTVGAIAALQKQHNLPVTGEVDDETEDTIENASPKLVSIDRANETAKTLSAKGSVTIDAATDASNITHGVTASGVGIAGASLTAIVSSIKDQVDVVKTTTDVVPGLTEKVTSFVTDHIPLFAMLLLGFILVYLAKQLYSSHNVIIAERVRKSASGEDMSR